MKLSSKDRIAYDPLARRLCAAFLSTQMGLKSVDYAQKQYVTGDISDFWITLARDLTADRTNAIGAALTQRLHLAPRTEP